MSRTNSYREAIWDEVQFDGSLGCVKDKRKFLGHRDLKFWWRLRQNWRVRSRFKL